MRPRLPLLTACALLAAATAAPAQNSFLGKEPPEVSAPAWVNADVPPSLAGLRGRPVLLVFWGLRCQVCHCRPVIRSCAGLHRTYARQGLAILALHMHRVPDEEVEAFALLNDLRFPVGNGGYYTAYGLAQVPYLYLVDNEGRVAWEGAEPGGDLSKKIRACLRDVSWMGEGDWPRSLRPLRRLVAARSFGTLLEKLLDFSSDAENAEEDRAAARAFHRKLVDRAEAEYLRATSCLRRGDPLRGMAVLESLASEYRGHPAARKARRRIEEAEADPELAGPLRAAELYRSFRTLVRAGNLRGASARARQLLAAHGDGVYARKVRALLEALEKVERDDG